MQLTDRARKRSLIPIFLTYFLDNFGLAIIYPIFTPLVLNIHADLFSVLSTDFTRTLTLGLLLGSFPLAQFIGAPFIGQFSDQYGRKRSFYFTILGTAVGYLLTGIAIFTNSLYLLFFSRWITGFFAGNLTICLAALADLCPDEQCRAKTFGHISALGGVSFVCAILIGGILSDPNLYRHFSPALPFWITGGLSLLNFVLMITLFHETHPPHFQNSFHPFKGMRNLKIAFVDPILRTLNLVNFFFKLAWIPAMQFLPSLLIKHYHFTSGQVTTILIGLGVMWALSNWFINRFLSARVYPGMSLLFCLGFFSLFCFIEMIPWAPFLFLILFYVLVGFATLSWTTGLTTISLKISPENQGTLLGVNQSITTIAAVAGPVIGGLLSGIDHSLIFLFSGICGLAAFFLLRIGRAYRP